MPVQPIIANAPVWVWPLFATLVVFGLVQARPRAVARPIVLILPALMVGFSIFGTITSFGLSPVTAGAWMAGLAIALSFAGAIWASLSDVRYRTANRTYEIPGSIIPLALMMAIFALQFGTGIAKVINPQLVANPLYAAAISAALGFSSGLFVARARTILRTARTIAA